MRQWIARTRALLLAGTLTALCGPRLATAQTAPLLFEFTPYAGSGSAASSRQNPATPNTRFAKATHKD